MTKPSSDQLSSLRRALERHLPLLRQAMAHRNRFETDLPYFVAGQLRALLCDQEIPILIEYAGAQEIPLYIWVTVDPVSTESINVRLQLSGLLASWDPMPLTSRVLLTTYLHSKLHVVGYRTSFTPCQLINRAANRVSVADSDSSHSGPPSLQRATKSPGMDYAIEEYEMRSMIYQMGDWTSRAIEHVLQAQQPG